jgi:hypothetical protein
MLGIEFPKKKPKILKNPETGGYCEYDGYNEEVGMAFEYQGEQHYEFNEKNKFFLKSKEEFHELKRRDKFKKRVAKVNGIHLIIIPHTVKVENIEKEIRKQIPERLQHLLLY